MNQQHNSCLNIIYSNLNSSSQLSAENQTALAELIFDTDSYIYPAMFGNRENASIVLPLLFYSSDSMFRLENFYIANKDGQIIGLLLWVKGRLNWSPELLRTVSLRAGIQPSPYLDLVAREYVDKYAENEKRNVISIINLCVSSEFRGRGVGRTLMQRFIEQHHDSTFELCALAGNMAAVHLYRSLGFEIVERYNGFSIDHKQLDAIVMQRKPMPW